MIECAVSVKYKAFPEAKRWVDLGYGEATCFGMFESVFPQKRDFSFYQWFTQIAAPAVACCGSIVFRVKDGPANASIWIQPDMVKGEIGYPDVEELADKLRDTIDEYMETKR